MLRPGTGKETGDRHPKVHDNVLIGACATILGNIAINKGAQARLLGTRQCTSQCRWEPLHLLYQESDPPLAPQVAAGSLVLKDVAPRTMVAGSPAKVVGTVEGALACKGSVGSRVFTQQAACQSLVACLLCCWT